MTQAPRRRSAAQRNASSPDFAVRFWGVRGSIACPGPETVRYGGNTSCVEMRCGPHILVFDAGTGIRELGARLFQGKEKAVDLFLSHTHHDHIGGLPFFKYAFQSDVSFRIWSGHLPPGGNIESVLRAMMAAPFFPVPVDIFHADISYVDFRAGEVLDPVPGVQIRTAPLNHPNGATGYRVTYSGRSVCYVTDHSHVPGQKDDVVVELIRDSDIVIYDAMFTDEEFAECPDWGHSSWQACLRTCRAANVKTPVIFHHLPERSDTALDAIASEVAAEFPGALVACEGQTLTP